MAEQFSGALKGVRVLDLADETAIFGTKLLSDLGADVLRIEPPEGDAIRRFGPFAGDQPGPDLSLSHWWYNSGKRSAIVDLGTTGGRDQVAALARNADIVIEAGHPGLDFAAIRAEKPELTVVSVSPFGRSGPRRDWLGPDLVIWAMGGGMNLTGLPGRPPLRANWSIANQIAGLYAGTGALAGLYHARTTGQGIHFDLSRYEAMVSFQETLVVLQVFVQRSQTRQGVENPVVAPYGTFPAKDGKNVMMAVVTQGQWQTLVTWMLETGEVPDWILDEQLLTMGIRAQHRERVHEFVGQWTRGFDSAEIVAEANRRRIPAAPVNSPLDVLQDEQLNARGFFQEIEVPLAGRTVRYPSFAYQFPGGAAIRPAPALGSSQPEFSSERPAPAGADNAFGDGTAPFGVPGDWPLAGLKVLDLTWALAGPTGTRALADLGAALVKIEPRDIGDIVRGLPPHWQGTPDPNRSGFFQRLGRNKRNLTLDLKKPQAIALVKRLVGWADVVIDNFGAGVMGRLGLGPEELLAIKPNLVQVSLSGYGQEGPTRNYPSFAQVSQARGGLTYSTAYPDGTTTGFGISYGDTGAGMQLAIVTLAALEKARRSGEGVYVDMSQLEAAVMGVGPALLDASVNGRAFTPQGNLLPDRLAAPHDAYPTEGDDRWIAIACLTEDHWHRLAGAMGRDDLLADPRFASAADRVAHFEALNALIAEWTKDQEAHALAERLQADGVPAGVVQNATDILERDPQLQERGFYQQVEQPEMATIPMDTMPLRWTDGPVPIRTPSPLIGEWNEWVLKEVLGLSDEDYVDLLVNEVL